MELIIPTTDTPGAIDLKLNIFIDAYIDAVWIVKIKEDFYQRMDKCLFKKS